MLTITDDDDVPGLPRAFNVAAGDVNAVLTWERPASIGTSEIEGYQYRSLLASQTFRDSDEWKSVTEPTATVTDLDNGEAYQFQVRAQNGVTKDGVNGGPAVTGTGTPWPVVTLALTPQIVTEKGDENESVVTATVAADNTASKPFTVTVSAEAVSPAVAGDFTLAGRTLSFAANATDATGDVTITAVDNPVDAADNATVTVSGTMSTGSDAPASEELTIADDDLKPGAVTGLSSTAGVNAATVAWSAPTITGTADITHYQYRYRETAEAVTTYSEWTTVDGGENAGRVTVSGLEAAVQYTFGVRAVSDAGALDDAAATITVTPTAS